VSNSQTFSLPFRLNRRIESTLQQWEQEDRVRRMWSADPTLWTGSDEARWLGWLSIVEEQLTDPERFAGVSEDVRSAGFRFVLLIGMGGSSLCPEVLARTYGPVVGSPRLFVLDSTDSGQIRTVEDSIRLEETLVVVSSKSGTTLESTILLEYFLSRLSERVGSECAGGQLIAITDPGSGLEARARELGFRRIFLGAPDIGGRFSALSDYGMILAAMLGIDVGEFLRNARNMVSACSGRVTAARNPAVALGVTLGVAAESGADKITFVISEPIASFGAWLEQLLAESLGKQGRALIPVDGEAPALPGAYGDDRIFVYLRLATMADASQDDFVSALEEAGRPVVRIDIPGVMDLAQEFFRWELATAVAGSVMGLNPFDQPDVEATKVATRKLMAAYEQSGELPPEAPSYQDETIALFGSSDSAASLEDCLVAQLDLIEPGDYIALLAYFEMSDVFGAAMGRIRRRLRDVLPNAVTLGFGPRFLHSTGQAHKGGPNTGVFFVLTRDPARDIGVPGRPYSFGLVIGAQARGDCDALRDRGRRVLRIHLKGDSMAALEALDQAFGRALSGRSRHRSSGSTII
jgi:transaldolase/glucose-6-phosphate isomerase